MSYEFALLMVQRKLVVSCCSRSNESGDLRPATGRHVCRAERYCARSGGLAEVALLGVATATASAQLGNPEAYDAFLQAQYFCGRRSKENFEKAVRYYEQAIKLDPSTPLGGPA